MAKILLTGAAGFIGSFVAHELIDRGFAVDGIDNLNQSYDVRLKDWRLEKLRSREGFRFRRLDIRDRTSLEDLWKENEYDTVINLAARAGVRPSVVDPWDYFESNLTGALNLLDLSRSHGVKKFVQASTSSLYGASNARPYKEDANIGKPLSPYAASKGAAEMLCHSYHHLYGIDITVLRYFTVYGPAGRPDMSIFRFIQWISEGRPVVVYGDGLQERDFTFVRDIALGTVAARKPVGFEVINLGSDHPFQLLDVIHQIESKVGKSAMIEHREQAPADVRATWADIHKARELLDWEPATQLDQGLGDCVDWYVQNKDWARLVHTSDG